MQRFQVIYRKNDYNYYEGKTAGWFFGFEE